MTRPRLSLAAAAAAAALAASLVPGAVSGGAATALAPTAAPGEPSVSLRGAPGEMWADRDRAYGDLGVRLATSDGRVELRTRRTDWAKQPETRYFPGGWVEGTTTWTDGVKVPRRMMEGFDRLLGVVDIVVRRADGTGPKVERSVDGCLNGYEPERLGPDSPAEPHYPGGCPRNPFTVGSVQGIEAGYAASVQDWTRLPIGAGRYTVRATIGEAWAELLGVTEGRSVTYPLRVRGDDEGGRREARERAEGAVPPAEPGPRPAPTRGSGGMADMDGMAHSAATQACDYEPGAEDPLPDLESLPAFGIDARGENLSFAATVWNSGDSPLVVDGFRRADEELMDAYQYFYSRDEDGDLTQEGYCGVGAMHWHAAPSHHHWHFLDFARYRLLSEDRSTVVRSTKQSFCLANTDAVDYTRPGADWRPEGTDLSSACGSRSAQSLRQVLSAGSGDTYTQYRAGQAFRLKGLPNGTYFISVEANPRDLLHEADEDASKDIALRKVVIGGEPGARTVTVPKEGLICGQPRNACD
ncbi:lysyl oxidase family protein [uncultured Nocardioides sp.]|uniref:lysyl oxidase family protein n=1 Tax=uncultured Nocardioides sp. TaxID=198441 RepID=UPI002629E9D7|nr:lysyl oxidase family protein [uncultured Nocardioides sp.]